MNGILTISQFDSLLYEDAGHPDEEVQAVDGDELGAAGGLPVHCGDRDGLSGTGELV